MCRCTYIYIYIYVYTFIPYKNTHGMYISWSLESWALLRLSNPEILKRNPSTATNGQRKVVGQFQDWPPMQPFCLLVAPLAFVRYLLDTFPSLMLDTLNTLDTLNFPCFCLTQAEALPVFYHVLPCFTMLSQAFPPWSQVRIANGQVGEQSWWTRRLKSSLVWSSLEWWPVKGIIPKIVLFLVYYDWGHWGLILKWLIMS